MKKTALVSVVIPVYNGSEYLEAAVNSVLKSSFTNYEILLINDGSTDNSPELCQKISNQNSKIRFINLPKNRGLGNVLNVALKQAKGKYICRLNQDDLIHKDRLKLQVNYLESHTDTIAIGSQLQFFNHQGNLELINYALSDESIKSTWYLVSPFADPAVMYHRQAAIKVGGYKQKFWPAEDLHMWYRLGQLGKLANLPETLTKMRIHKKAASNKHFHRQIINTFRVHFWANNNLKPASITVKCYWLVQLASGVILGPKFNWFMYKYVKQTINYLLRLQIQTVVTNMVNIVKFIPKRLSFSGS